MYGGTGDGLATTACHNVASSRMGKMERRVRPTSRQPDYHEAQRSSRAILYLFYKVDGTVYLHTLIIL